MRGLFFIAFSLLCCACFSQQFPQREVDMSALADHLYGFPDEDLNYDDIYENMAQLLAHPLDLNKASAEDLRFIKVLSEVQIQALLVFRKENGNFVSVYELQSIPELDLETLYTLMPFVKVDDPNTVIGKSLWQRVKNESDNYILYRQERTLENKKGFSQDLDPDNKFLGSPDKMYLRFRSSRSNDFSFGFTAEKDPGEQLLRNTKNKIDAPDYFSFHVQVQNKGRIKNLIIGDFQSQFGQGLTFGGAFGMGKGGETITTVRRSNIGLQPYTSVFEAGNFRGAGATIAISKNIFISTLYSNTKRDATLADDTISTFASSRVVTGLHRNVKELSKKNVLKEQNAGAVLQFKNDRLDAGVLFHQTWFTPSLHPNPSLYNQFAFAGSSNQNAGVYLNYIYKNISFFSEANQTLDHGKSYVAGTLWSLSQSLDLAILHRHFGKDYHAFYSNAFAEGSTTQNETGTYWGWKYRFNKKYSLQGYFDLFKFPWLKFRSYSPSNGHEHLLRFIFQPSRSTLLYIQFREESKDRNISDDKANLYLTSTGRKRNYWINLEYGIGKKLKMKTRGQYSTYDFNQLTTQGIALMQDISFDISKFQCTMRYALFDTDDFDNRQYVYENDVWLAFSLPAYNGRGVRRYVMLEYKVNKTISVWLRYSNTQYLNQQEIGSGLDAIHGNSKNDVKFETRIKF